MTRNGLIPKEILLGTPEQAADYVQTIRTLRTANVELSKQADAEFRSNGLLFIRELEKLALEDTEPVVAEDVQPTTTPEEVNYTDSAWSALTSPGGLGVVGGVVGGGIAAVNELSKKKKDRNWWNTLVGAGIGGGVGWGGGHLMNIGAQALDEQSDTAPNQRQRQENSDAQFDTWLKIPGNEGLSRDDFDAWLALNSTTDDSDPNSPKPPEKYDWTDYARKWTNSFSKEDGLFPLPMGLNTPAIIGGLGYGGSLLGGSNKGVEEPGGFMQDMYRKLRTPDSSLAKDIVTKNMPVTIENAVDDAINLVRKQTDDDLRGAVQVGHTADDQILAESKVKLLRDISPEVVIRDLTAAQNSRVKAMSPRKLVAGYTNGYIDLNGLPIHEAYIPANAVHVEVLDPIARAGWMPNVPGRTEAEFISELKGGRYGKYTRREIKAQVHQWKIENPLIAESPVHVAGDIDIGDAAATQTNQQRLDHLAKVQRNPGGGLDALQGLQREMDDPHHHLANTLAGPDIAGKKPWTEVIKSPLAGAPDRTVHHPGTQNTPGTVRMDYTPDEVAQLKAEAIKTAKTTELQTIWTGRSKEIPVRVTNTNLAFDGDVTVTRADIQAVMSRHGGKGNPLTSATPTAKVTVTLDDMRKFLSTVKVDVRTGSISMPDGGTVTLKGDQLILTPKPQGLLKRTLVKFNLVSDSAGEYMIDPRAIQAMQESEFKLAMDQLDEARKLAWKNKEWGLSKRIGRVMFKSRLWVAAGLGVVTDVFEGLELMNLPTQSSATNVGSPGRGPAKSTAP